MGAAAFGVAPIFQNFAYRSTPDIPETVGALAASSFNVGTAVGSAVGGQIVAAYSVHDVTWVGGLVVTAALAVATYALRTAAHKARTPAAEPGLTSRSNRLANTQALNDPLCWSCSSSSTKGPSPPGR